jgi:hypothetical protein
MKTLRKPEIVKNIINLIKDIKTVTTNTSYFNVKDWEQGTQSQSYYFNSVFKYYIGQ